MEGFGPIQVAVGGHRVEATEQGRADGHPTVTGSGCRGIAQSSLRRDGRLSQAFPGWSYFVSLSAV